MKNLLVLALAFVSTLAFADVDSKKIKSVADQLTEYTASAKEFKVKPASPLFMMKELALKQLDFSDFEYDVESSMQTDAGTWGLIKMADAISWVAGSDYLNYDELGEEIKNSPKAKAAAKLMRSLYGSGVVFGAAPIGAVQCGVTFPALLLIDSKSGMIYSFETEGSGC